MKRSSAMLMAFVTLIIGFIAGLMWAAYKGPPPMPQQATGAPPAAPAPASVDPAEFQSRLEALQDQIKAKPDDVNLYVQAGNLSFDHEQYQEAVRYYEQALELGGQNPNVLSDIGVSYRRLGQPEKAVEYLTRARQVDPTHETSALNLGIVLFHDLQDHPAALKVWREYLALNPQGPRVDMIRRVVEQLEKQQAEPAEKVVKPQTN